MTIIDPSNYTVAAGDDLVRLTRCEFAIFMALVRANGRTLPYDFLCDVMNEVTGKETWIESLRVHKTKIDRKLKKFGVTVMLHYGIGYSLPKLDTAILPRAEEVLMQEMAG